MTSFGSQQEKLILDSEVNWKPVKRFQKWSNMISAVSQEDDLSSRVVNRNQRTDVRRRKDSQKKVTTVQPINNQGMNKSLGRRVRQNRLDPGKIIKGKTTTGRSYCLNMRSKGE